MATFGTHLKNGVGLFIIIALGLFFSGLIVFVLLTIMPGIANNMKISFMIALLALLFGLGGSYYLTKEKLLS